VTAKLKGAKPNKAQVPHNFFTTIDCSWKTLQPRLHICNYESDGIHGAVHLAGSEMILKYSNLHKIKLVYKILLRFIIQSLVKIGHVTV
jgi:uncharacterized membrane protein